MRLWPYLGCLFAMVAASHAQAPSPSLAQALTVHDASEIAEHSQRLLDKAHSVPEGFAAETWQKFGNSYMMLAARTSQGAAEVHVHTGDYFVVLQGHVTELVGGTLTNGKETAAGELRGSAITGGEKRVLGPGDLVHISANTPHQTLMSGEPFVYLVIKVQE